MDRRHRRCISMPTRRFSPACSFGRIVRPNRFHASGGTLPATRSVVGRRGASGGSGLAGGSTGGGTGCSGGSGSCRSCIARSRLSRKTPVSNAISSPATGSPNHTRPNAISSPATGSPNHTRPNAPSACSPEARPKEPLSTQLPMCLRSTSSGSSSLVSEPAHRVQQSLHGRLDRPPARRAARSALVGHRP